MPSSFSTVTEIYCLFTGYWGLSDGLPVLVYFWAGFFGGLARLLIDRPCSTVLFAKDSPAAATARQNGIRIFSSVFSVSFDGSRYFWVVASDSWPSHTCSVRTSIPARSQRVAAA
ncbi:MAG TPA: hypothetical protein VFI95_11385 [Terriglobales bacterium]|nr:hypothetical protein [Terriglobales bacterium]